jgi:hypothetical protein
VAYVVFGGDPGRLRISADGQSAAYTDPDGDLVTVTTSVGTFTADTFKMHTEGAGFQLEDLQLTSPAFAHADLTILAKRQDWNKDGMKDGNRRVDVGFIDATGVDLRTVIVAGDLGQIDCGDGDPLLPGLKSLSVRVTRSSWNDNPGSCCKSQPA